MDIIICGIGGRMGTAVYEAACVAPGVNVVAGVDKRCEGSFGYPVYPGFDQCKERCDVVIDFSRPDALEQIISYCERTGAAAVLATTGYTQQHREMIEKAAEKIPILQSSNMSLGINLLTELVRKAAEALPDFDIEIVEKHHNRKVDAPSGTALMLAESVNSAFSGKKKYIFGRHSSNEPRTKEEIGIHAIRGGTVAGVHDVMFLGNDEIVTLSHTALSRRIFEEGALKAAFFLKDKSPGLYSMRDLFRK